MATVITAAAANGAAQSRWWTVQDVASYRGVTPRTVYQWVARAKAMARRGQTGGIPFSQPKGTKHLRFKPEAIRAFFGDQEAA